MLIYEPTPTSTTLVSGARIIFKVWPARLLRSRTKNGPRRSKVGVAPEVTWNVGGALRSLRQVGGDEIGQLLTEQHDVSGTLHVTDTRTLSFEGFNYDGLGPGN